MDDPLPLDVTARLKADFGERADAAAALLHVDDPCEYIVRCIIHAARGDESKVQHLIELNREDYRDVINAGEYDELKGRIRDLRVSFLIDSEEKLWVGEVACMMALRGYRLTSLETHPATAGPFDYTCDHSEGRANFIGPKGEIGIEKKDRQWTVHGNRPDLEIHELDHAFDDENTFRDAVSCYLLSKVSARAVDEPNAVPTAKRAGKLRWQFWK